VKKSKLNAVKKAKSKKTTENPEKIPVSGRLSARMRRTQGQTPEKTRRKKYV